MKICSKCGEEKELSEFSKVKQNKDGYCGKCKVCERGCKREWEVKNKEYLKEKHRIAYEKNKEDRLTKCKIYAELNRSKIKEQKKIKYDTMMSNLTDDERRLKNEKANNYRNANKEAINLTNKKYYNNNKEEINKRIKDSGYKAYENRKEYYKEYKRKQRDTNPVFKLRYNLRASMNYHIRNKGSVKKNSTVDILGCSIEEFRLYLESKFEPWMNWDNYGNPKDGIIEPNKTFDIDHIIPMVTAKTEEDVIRLSHYTNLQPLCSYVNRFIKSGKILD